MSEVFTEDYGNLLKLTSALNFIDLDPPTSLVIVLSNTNRLAQISFDVNEISQQDSTLYSGVKLEVELPDQSKSTHELNYPSGRSFAINLTSFLYGAHAFELTLIFNATVEKAKSVIKQRRK